MARGAKDLGRVAKVLVAIAVRLIKGKPTSGGAN